MKIREADTNDLPAINQVVEKAVMNWNLPERVKRLALQSYLYNPLDCAHYQFLIATEDDVTGVAVLDTEDQKAWSSNEPAALLHGLYVLPPKQGQRTGSKLFAAAEELARRKGYAHLLVKAQKEAESFFIKQGMQNLKINDPSRQYARSFVKKLT